MEFTVGLLWRKQKPGPRICGRRRPVVPRLEVLEDRRVPTLTLNPDGMTVHDSVTNMNWLANADLAATVNPDGTPNRDGMTFGVQSINPDGSMTWTQALKWVYEMNQFKNPDGSVGYLHHTDWALPGKFAGAGFNQTTSDMGELFYNEFGGKAGESVADIFSSNPKLTRLFKNFQAYLYWDQDAKFPGGAQFSFGNGFQGTSKDIDVMYAIPEYHGANPSIDPGAYDSMPTGSVPVSPSLVPVDNGHILHDTALDIDWLADANLAKTNPFGLHQGVNPHPKDPKFINVNLDGSMNYNTAVAWVTAMNAQDYLGHNDWRLPITTDTKANYYISGGGVGKAFRGSEMGELYYRELGGQAGSTILLTHDSFAAFFHHFQPYVYWSGTHTTLHEKGHGYSTLSFGSGFQGANFNNDALYVIPVRDGSGTEPNNRTNDSPASLRPVGDADSIGSTNVFSPGSTGQTITPPAPIYPRFDDGAEKRTVAPEGPGPGQLSGSGHPTQVLFAIGPYPGPRTPDGTFVPVDIAGLTLDLTK
jgi:hypothetical protein